MHWVLYIPYDYHRPGCKNKIEKVIPHGMKILHGIKFYGFKVANGTVKLKSVNFYYNFSINSAMSLLNYYSCSNTKNKGSSSSLSSVPLPTSVPS